MRNDICRKGLVVGIIILFIGTTALPVISEENETINTSVEHEKSYSDWWPMFQHDSSHSGYSTSTGPMNNILWESQLFNDYSDSAPVIVDGKVYIGSNLGIFYCLDAYTGEEIWNYSLGSNFGVGTPALFDNKVYFGGTSNPNVCLYCLNANTGNDVWIFMTNGVAICSVTVADEKIYFCSQDDSFYCLNAYTGEEVWNSSIGSGSISPVVTDGKLYVGGNKLYCLNANTGNEIWNYNTGVLVYPPTVCNGKVYVGEAYQKFYCFNAETGAKIWDYTAGNPPYSTPAVAYGKVYFSNGGIPPGDGKLTCLNAETGGKIWDREFPYRYQDSSPAIADGKVYFSNGNIFCMNADNGQIIWEYETLAGLSSSAIANGKLYIGNNDGVIYCFGEDDGIRPPIVDFTWTPSNPKPNQPIDFDASASHDPNGHIVLYEWDWNNDNIYDESHQSSTTQHSWENSGYYKVNLRVTDNESLTATKIKSIYVGDPNLIIFDKDDFNIHNTKDSWAPTYCGYARCYEDKIDLLTCPDGIMGFFSSDAFIGVRFTPPKSGKAAITFYCDYHGSIAKTTGTDTQVKIGAFTTDFYNIRRSFMLGGYDVYFENINKGFFDICNPAISFLDYSNDAITVSLIKNRPFSLAVYAVVKSHIPYWVGILMLLFKGSDLRTVSTELFLTLDRIEVRYL